MELLMYSFMKKRKEMHNMSNIYEFLSDLMSEFIHELMSTTGFAWNGDSSLIALDNESSEWVQCQRMDVISSNKSEY